MTTRTSWLRSPRTAAYLPLAAVCLVALFDYASRAARVITQHDPAELQMLAQVGGVPHGTSYPLYMWLLRGMALLPISTQAFRYNLFSVLCGSLTLATLGWLTAQLDRKSRPRAWVVGALAAAALGVSHGFTSIAIFTGMYTFHMVLAFLGLSLLVRWTYAHRGSDVVLALVVFGTMLANHIMTLALAPGVLVLIGWTLWQKPAQWRFVARGIALAVAAFVVLDVFLFWLLWRNHVSYDHWWGIILGAPEFFQLPPHAAGSFWYAWWYEATCRQFQYDALGANDAQRWRELTSVIPLVFADLSPFVGILAAAGALRLALERNLRVLALVVIVIATHVYLAIGFTAPDKFHVYLLPVVALVAALGAYALCWPLERLPARLQEPRWLVLGALVLTGLGVLGREVSRDRFAQKMAHGREWWLAPVRVALGPRPDERDEHETLDRARVLLDSLPRRGVVFASWEDMYTLHYVGRIERGTHDLAIYQPLMFGRGGVAFASDYVRIVADPARTQPVFLVGNWRLPEVPGYRRVLRAPEVYEWVRGSAEPTDEE